jgi:hypothetical protein
MWGAGGGGGYNGKGGAGAALRGYLAVTPGETLTIVVGQAGGRTDNVAQPIRYGGGGGGIDTPSGAYYSATGGGRSAIRRSAADIVTVGGGGGASPGSTNVNTFGGAGSATGTGYNGNRGSLGAGDVYDGKGGSTTAGGAAGVGNPTFTPSAGSLYTGGYGGNYCGAGGGGYYGGGGGTIATTGNGSTGGGGGGGSSLTTNLTGFVGYNSSDGFSAPFTTSIYYNGTAAVGGLTGGGTALGGNGLVVIVPMYTFTPVFYSGCKLWLDGTDPGGSGIIPANNSTIATWYDKSGSGNNATQTTVATRPMFKQSYVNGNGAVYFTSSNQMALPSLTLGPLTIFVIGKLVTFSSNQFFLALGQGTDTIYVRAVFNPPYFGVDTGIGPYTTTVADTNYHMFSYTQTNVGSFWFDGTTITTSASISGNAAGSMTYTTTNTIGGWSGYTNNVDSVLSEVIIYNSALTTTNRQQVEGYLAWKWGLQGSLPSGHAYKSVAPVGALAFNGLVTTLVSNSGMTYPEGIAQMADGNLVVADTWNQRICKITYPGGVVTTLAGSGNAQLTDGTGTNASFYYPTGIAVMANGNIIVGDNYNFAIRMVTPAGVVTTLKTIGDTPYGVAVIPSTNTIVIGNHSGVVMLLTYPGAVLTTLATLAPLNGVAVLQDGNIVVAVTDAHRIQVVTVPGGVVTTLAGSGTPTHADGVGTNASFNGPQTVAVLANGNVVVSGGNENYIRMITYPGGVVTTIAGGSSAGNTDGVGTNAQFNGPFGIAVLSGGILAVNDVWTGRVRLIS